MSGIVLSASVRQNLLSLQSTADLLATTQNRLSTGKKVNTALDNPTNFFTAQGLDNRANDISNLLDGIGNGVQVLQAANTGITSLQKLVDTAKSIAYQVLQTTGGYTPRSTVSSALRTRRSTNASSRTMGKTPLRKQLAKKISPKLGAITQLMPIAISAVTAPSRDEPQPKFRPASSIGALRKRGWLNTQSGLADPSGR